MGDFVNTQDFKQVILRRNNGSKPGNTGGGSGGVRVEITKQQKALLADDDDNTPKVKHFGSENAKILQSARLAKQMTQQQLANSINEKPQIINAYENGGKVVPDNKILQKLRRVLNIKFV